MRVLALDSAPVLELPYLNAAPGGGTIVERLPLLRGRVDRLPDDLDALLVTSDLQGVMPSPSGGGMVLAGEALAEHIAMWSDASELPRPERLGVVLAGDLYSAPGADVRGATGDVFAVWAALAGLGCPLVIGVAGNHDEIDDARGFAALGVEANVAMLDGEVRAHGGVRFGGVGYVKGNPDKRGKRSEADFHARLDAVLIEQPDVVVLHQGPDGEDRRRQRGDVGVRQALTDAGIGLTICGHIAWATPLSRLGADGQVLNVDGRIVVLTADR